MAYYVVGTGINTKSFVCDTQADVSKLPTRLRRGAHQDDFDDANADMVGAGSDATVIAPAGVYMLQYEGDMWKKL